MLKIKRLKLSGFRGILAPQEILLNNGGKTQSLVVYGLNSSGKTSFVDGLEWFFSPHNEIEWLKREDAGIKAYTHLEAKKDNSYVEVEFDDDKKEMGILRKTFNNEKITQPILSSSESFAKIYGSIVIRPYLRYLEIIEFVFNSTGVQKYQKLATWMGFQDELAFQEKIALEILPALDKVKEAYSEVNKLHANELTSLVGFDQIKETEVIDYCKNLLSPYTKFSLSTTKDFESMLPELEKLKISSESSTILGILSKNEIAIELFVPNKDLFTKCDDIKKQINILIGKKEVINKIDFIDLYNQANGILNKTIEEETNCPVCGTTWKKEELILHIKDELALLEEVKEEKAKITSNISTLKTTLHQEYANIEKLLENYLEVQTIIPSIKFDKAKLYKSTIEQIELKFSQNLFEGELTLVISDELSDELISEKEKVCKLIEVDKKKIEPSKEEIKRNDDIEKLKKIYQAWSSYSTSKQKLLFYQQEIEKFLKIANELSDYIQESISSRFKDISALIGEYFSILRSDKDIKEIEIVLNTDKGRAIGRSAEIQLSYYNITVKPAYKVLSESLLNSLGLAVYFACIRKFNENTNFVILDDIMNSLDTSHRDTLLDLMNEKFSDYQMILFTHDLHWFEKIQRRFPSWIKKKIKSWDYTGGPKIDMADTTLDEVKELLKDSSKATDAGSKFGGYVEGTLNELCEDLHAELRYRFNRNDPPAMEELLTALYKRLKDRLNKNPIVDLIDNARKYEPLLRNSTTHPRQNYSSSISPQEVQRGLDEWEKVHDALWCKDCNNYVYYRKDVDSIECRCGHLKLNRIS